MNSKPRFTVNIHLPRLIYICLLFLYFSPTTSATNYQEKTYDIVVYGGTSAGIATAVQAKRLGKSVIVVGPDIHLGGLSSSGLGWTDSGNKSVIGGLAREFYQHVYTHYEDDSAWRQQKRSEYGNRGQGSKAIDGSQRTMWIFEPHVAESIFEKWVEQHNIPVIRNEWLNRKSGVHKHNNKIASITMLSGKTFKGKMFIDATYEGDLLAAAGVSYTVGREANSKYGETLNGVQTRNARSHQFNKKIDPYIEPGNPKSGLLPRIHDGSPGNEGAADKKMQAYCYRMCLTNVKENQIPFPKPDNYDPMQYELLARYLDTGWRDAWRKFDPIPNHKTDTNNHGAFSTDNIGMNYDYPEASYERRKEILKEHTDYQQGLMWFLSNDPRTPKDVREKMSQWGLAKDEFKDNAGWPHQIYVREGRRMVSDFVMSERHLRKQKPTPKPIGMGSYNMDSHNVQRYVAKDKNGVAYARNEGDVQVNPGGPYPISYEAIIPKQSECENLLVPVCLSSSHIAYGSIRMEPVFMILGHSAASAASIAIDHNLPVQKVPYDLLEAQLIKEKQVLKYTGPARKPKSAIGIDPKNLKGIVLDDTDAKTEGVVINSTSVGPFVNFGYIHDNNQDKGKFKATFTPNIPKPGTYEVLISYTPSGNRAANTPVTLYISNDTKHFKINQKLKPNGKNGFHSLGKFLLPQGNKDFRIEITNTGTTEHVIVDAIQIIPLK